jgi:hypothetical protein
MERSILERCTLLGDDAEMPGKQIRGVDIGADGVNLFTRGQAAKFLRVNVRLVRLQAEKGRLECVVIRGVECFTRKALEQYRAMSQRGQLASKAFRALEQGKSPAELVIDLMVSPDLAREFAQQYAELSGAWLVAGPSGPRENWERTYKIGELTPFKLRRALELAACTPELNRRLLESA